jgi:hypothetical protein
MEEGKKEGEEKVGNDALSKSNFTANQDAESQLLHID